MGEEHGHSEHFTDEDLAFLRYARFGQLPDRVTPAELVETAETDPPPEEPPEPTARREWG